MNKGQVFTADFIASITLFSLFILFFGVAWNTSVVKFSEDKSTTSVQNDYTFSLLKTSASNPSESGDNFNSSVGLFDGVYFDESRFMAFKENLSSVEKSTLLKAQGFIVDVNFLNGSNVSYKGVDLSVRSSGIPETKSVFTSSSIVVLEESRKRALLNYYTWEN
mgnify:CR=1 FL=1